MRLYCYGKAMLLEIREEREIEIEIEIKEELSCFEPTRRTSTASLEDFLDARVPMQICKSFVRSLLQAFTTEAQVERTFKSMSFVWSDYRQTSNVRR